ncbi:MAG: hypothetical protein R6U96_02640 [Promethearchaeia archaeon]
MTLEMDPSFFGEFIGKTVKKVMEFDDNGNLLSYKHTDAEGNVAIKLIPEQMLILGFQFNLLLIIMASSALGLVYYSKKKYKRKIAR